MTNLFGADLSVFRRELAWKTIADVAEIVREAYPSGKGLILTGSAARDEATIAVTPTGVHWLSDLEFLVVSSASGHMGDEDHALDRLASEIGDRLEASGVSVAVELTAVSKAYFTVIRPHLFAYELRECGRQLFGEDDYLQQIPRFHWSEIPKEDAWRLISNRMVEWLDYVLTPRRHCLPEQFYILMKEYLDLATSLSLFSGHYAPRYEARAEALGHIGSWVERMGLDTDVERLISAVRVATDFKLDPRSRFEALWSSDPGDLPDALDKLGCRWLYDQLPATLSAVWNWEARHIGSGGEVKAEEATGLGRIYGLRDRARGWARLLWHAEGDARSSALRRLPRLFLKGTPRSLIYDCTARLLQSRDSHDPSTVQWVRRHLPVTFGGCGDEWTELGGQCVKAWSMFLRRSSA